MKAVLNAIGEGGSGGDPLADHRGGEAHRVLGHQFETAVAGIALHFFIAVVLRFNVDDSGAVRALTLVLAAIIPLVVFALGDLCQCRGFGLGIFRILAGLAGPAIRVTPWRFCLL